MTGRNRILARIQSAFTAGHGVAAALPAIRVESDEPSEVLMARFVSHARAYKVVVETCHTKEVPLNAARLLNEAGCASVLAPTGFPREWLPSDITHVHDDGALGRTSIAACDAVITTCTCAIAQTGTIVLDHGPGQGGRALMGWMAP